MFSYFLRTVHPIVMKLDTYKKLSMDMFSRSERIIVRQLLGDSGSLGELYLRRHLFTHICYGDLLFYPTDTCTVLSKLIVGYIVIDYFKIFLLL